MEKKIKLTKPFLKWAGGKTQIIDNIIKTIPKNINNYHEIFLGGGSVLLAILSLTNEKKIIIKNKINAYDINLTLINVYKNIQKNPNILYNLIENYINDYNNCNGIIINRKPQTIEEGKTSKESYYYWLRNEFNKSNKNIIKSSAIFMILNKLCFRGLYREGPNGFNVPFGHYKKTPTIISKNDINNISNLIKNVNFIHSDFRNSLKNIQINDFVYLDPPYVPIIKNSFTKYTKNDFKLSDHNKLFELIKLLNTKNIKFTLNNSKVNLVLETFKDFKIKEILCHRFINSKNPESKVYEVIITN